MFPFVNSVAMNIYGITRSLGLIRMNFCDWDFAVKEFGDFFLLWLSQTAGWISALTKGLNLGHSSERLES